MHPLRLDRLLTLYVVRAFCAVRLWKPPPGLPILMYHSVSDSPEHGVPAYYQTCTSPTRFREHLQLLRDQGYKSLSLHEALVRLNTGALGERIVVITFDDGFRDFYTHAAPLLEEFGFTATVYLPTGYIGGERRCFRGRECLCWQEVRELHRRGFSFGSHSVSHSRLKDLPWEEVAVELSDSKARMESELDEEIRDFAYPYAFPQHDRHFVNRFTQLLRRVGYRSCSTTIIGRMNCYEVPCVLKRLPVNNSDDEELLAAKINGLYDWLQPVQSVVKKRKEYLGLLTQRRAREAPGVCEEKCVPMGS